MTLNPDRYECPEHHTDLTGQVEEVLDERGPPVAFRRPLLGRRAPGPEPFQVIVTCPGNAGASAHEVTCTGTQTP